MSDMYDPSSTDDAPRRSQYVNRTQVIAALVFALFLLALATPLFLRMMDERNKYVCRTNLGAISKACLIYATENTDRLPPTHVTSSNYSPEMFEFEGKQRVNTWLTLISNHLAKPLEETRCPAASNEETTPTDGPEGLLLHTSYGMFGPLATLATANIPNEGGVVMISETANLGARETYDPLPFKGPEGELRPDGFLIGFDSSNFNPFDQANQIEKAKWATRLAFYGTKDGTFKPDGHARHGSKLHFIFADGHIKSLTAPAAEVLFKSSRNRWPIR